MWKIGASSRNRTSTIAEDPTITTRQDGKRISASSGKKASMRQPQQLPRWWWRTSRAICHSSLNLLRGSAGGGATASYSRRYFLAMHLLKEVFLVHWLVGNMVVYGFPYFMYYFCIFFASSSSHFFGFALGMMSCSKRRTIIIHRSHFAPKYEEKQSGITYHS